ncbi:MAG: aspartate kinase [Rhizobacter sp.]|nr:aspartate kinase [Rhizobacter sp.]
MWVVKLGGSLNADPLLPGWLEVIARHGAGRVVLVCGGGTFADAVRHSQAQWQFDDLAAHNMALLAMVQTAHLLRALNPALHLLSDERAIAPALAAGRSVLWSPQALLAERAGPDTNWDATSDSIALALAHRLGAQRLVVVKSCHVDPSSSLGELSRAGVIDRRFESLAQAHQVPVVFMHKAEAAGLQSMLLGGDSRPA